MPSIERNCELFEIEKSSQGFLHSTSVSTIQATIIYKSLHFGSFSSRNYISEEGI